MSLLYFPPLRLTSPLNRISKNRCFSCELNVSYSFGSRKLEHALKHGTENGLLVVSLAWFVDSVRQNGKHSTLMENLLSCTIFTRGRTLNFYINQRSLFRLLLSYECYSCFLSTVN